MIQSLSLRHPDESRDPESRALTLAALDPDFRQDDGKDGWQGGFTVLLRSVEHGFTPLRRSAEHGFTPLRRSVEHGFTPLRRSAEHGFTPLRRSAEHGFTLIELLVALVIFGMLAAAGVTLLSGTVRAEAAVSRGLEGMATVRRAASVMTQDFGQAIPRISRTEAGTLAPAFYARPEGDSRPLVQFVRSGWDNPDGAPRSDLQRLEYWIAGDRLERRSSAMVDGAPATRTATLFSGVANITLRFRDAGGAWQPAWTPTQPDLLPRAVEMTLIRRGEAPLSLLFLVGPGPLPKGLIIG